MNPVYDSNVITRGAQPAFGHAPTSPANAGVTTREWAQPFDASARYALIGHARGLAALAVLSFHSFGAEDVQPIWAPLEPLRAVASHGWLGVHVFFVLSGYCMSEKLASLAATNRGPAHFLLDRAWRIYPAYWGALLVTIALGIAAASMNTVGLAGAFPVNFRSLLADMLLFQPYLGTVGLLLVGWTLVCETGFYAITALLFSGWRAGLGFGGVLCAGALLTAAVAHVPDRATWMVLRLWPEFWVGMLVYGCTGPIWSERPRLRALCGAAIALFGLLVVWQPAGRFAGVHGAAVICAAGLVVLHRWDKPIATHPVTRWLGSVGVWSYSIYLIHGPLLSRWHNLVIHFAPAQSPRYALLWLGSLVLGLVGAWFFYRIVEAPVEAWRHSLFRRRPATVSK